MRFIKLKSIIPIAFIFQASCGVPEANDSSLAGSCVPAMTGPSNSAGTVSSSGDLRPEAAAWKAFDADAQTAWRSIPKASETWIAFRFNGGARTLGSYTIQVAAPQADGKGPKSWTFEAYAGNDIWYPLDKRSNQVNWHLTEKRAFNLPTNYFSHFRLRVTEDNNSLPGTQTIAFAKLTLSDGSCSH